MEMNAMHQAVFRENLEPQKVLGLPDPTYRAFKAVSKSGLDWMDVSPAHYKHVIIDGNAPDPTPSMIIGSAFDSLLLTPDQFEKDFAVAPNIRRGTKAWDEFEAQAGAKRVIKSEDFERLQEMRDSVMSNPLARSLISAGEPQVSYKWQDPTTGILCKSRADFVRSDNIMLDVKTTGEGGARISDFGKTAFNFRYHVQAAFYSDGAALVDKYPDAFVFLVIEREPPYLCAAFHIDQDLIALGRKEYEKNLDLYARCHAENNWPGYPTEIQKLSLPAWALRNL